MRIAISPTRIRPCRPIVIGGIEVTCGASRTTITGPTPYAARLFDAKADILVYGMGERTMTLLAHALRDGHDWRRLRSICYAQPANSDSLPADALHLPDYASVAAATPAGRAAFLEMFRLFAANQDPHTARPLLQQIDTRCLVHMPPDTPLSTAELDAVHALPFTLDVHPIHAAKGKVRALDTIRFSLATHRGCYGECNFCAIAIHQGRQVVSRSEDSIVEEARRPTTPPAFTGIIKTWAAPLPTCGECERKTKQGACASSVASSRPAVRHSSPTTAHRFPCSDACAACLAYVKCLWRPASAPT